MTDATPTPAAVAPVPAVLDEIKRRAQGHIAEVYQRAADPALPPEEREAAAARAAVFVDQKPTTVQDVKRGHFKRHFVPRLSEAHVDDLREMFGGVWPAPARTQAIGDTLGAVLNWDNTGLMLVGSTGSGKTLSLTYCCLRAITHPEWPTAALYLSVTDLQDHTVKPDWAELERIPLLALDELHAYARLADYRKEQVRSLIDRRYRVRTRCVTISAATVPWSVLCEEMGDENVYRLRQGAEVVDVRGRKNWRK